MRRILRDPLVHFLLAGAALFLLYGLRNTEPVGQQIVVDAAQVRQLSKTATAMRGEAPTREELERLVEPLIKDEVYYREALALGLDKNDDDVRTRLIDKMRYLTEDLADPEPATEDALHEFFDANPDLFLIPAKITFEQVFFSPSKRGEALQADIAAAIEMLRAGNDVGGLGDDTPLRGRYDEAPREQVSVLFGDAMAEALFTMESGRWNGPYKSDFGMHLARLISRSEARRPTFEESKETALELFAGRQRERRNEAAYRSMRDRYDIIVEWPDGVGVQ